MMRARLTVFAACLMLGGCVARVQETRAYGVSRPAPAAEVVATQERTASADGPTCRTVLTTTRTVREVDVRRSFVDPWRQQTNVALAVLAGLGSTFLAYDAASLACQNGGGCTGTLQSATWPIAATTAALAALPLGFVIYNAARVQDDVRIEPAPPITEMGPWGPCER
jgi:hypothetical protein